MAVLIVDYGLGNLRSIIARFKTLKVPCEISRDPQQILKAERLLLPGVGHFGKGMENLKKFGLIGALNEAVHDRHTPIAGICMGMQLLTKGSEEGHSEGLNWVPLMTRQFQTNLTDQSNRPLRVPHVGFNEVSFSDELQLPDLPERYFYFTHSYYVETSAEPFVVGRSWYGHDISAVLKFRNIMGCQFHPERSRLQGLAFLNYFAHWSPVPESQENYKC